jgi:hypothetical protein
MAFWKNKMTYNLYELNWSNFIQAKQRLKWNHLPNGEYKFIIKISKEVSCCKVGKYNVIELNCLSIEDSKPTIVSWSPFLLSLPLITFSRALEGLPLSQRKNLVNELYYYLEFSKKNRKSISILKLERVNTKDFAKIEEEFDRMG